MAIRSGPGERERLESSATKACGGSGALESCGGQSAIDEAPGLTPPTGTAGMTNGVLSKAVGAGR